MSKQEQSNPASEFEAVVQRQMDNVRTMLKTYVDEATAHKYTATETTLKEIRTDLAKLQERGESPTNEKVLGLEERLVQAEKVVSEIVGKLSAVPINQDEAREAKDRALFKGHLFVDEDQVRKAFRDKYTALQTGATVRAIDQSLFSTGGQLSAETADRFLDFVISKQVALSRVTTLRMMAPERHTDELRVSRRKLIAATPGVAQAVRDAIGTKRRTLTSVPVIWSEDIVLEFLEDNIERMGAEGHIMQLLATQFGNDLNDLAWNGDGAAASAGDTFTSINKGWIQLMLEDAEVADFSDYSGGLTNTEILRAMFRALPIEFKAMTGLGYFVPVPFAERYAEELSRRETTLGDQVTVGGFPVLRHFGLPIVPEPHLYEENEDRAVLTPFQNLYHGIQRQIMVDSMWQPRPGTIEITIRARNDYQYATGQGIVLASEIPSDNR